MNIRNHDKNVIASNQNAEKFQNVKTDLIFKPGIEFKKRLEAEEPQQFIETPDRPTHYEYAVFSQQVCQNDLGWDSLPKGWRLHAIYSTSESRLKPFNKLTLHHDLKSSVCWVLVDKKLPLTVGKNYSPSTLTQDLLDSGYVGAAYIHEGRQQIVLAHRGLSILNIGSLIGAISVKSDQINPQQVAALYATEQCIQFAENENYRFSVTGHGLGGWLAELCVYHATEENKPWFYRDMSAVTFDAPGSGGIMASLDSHLKDGRGVKREALDIIHYVSIPNLINTLNEQVGTVYRITPDLPKRFGVLEYLMFNIDSHNMELLLKAFDPKTGMPTTREQMLDWPKLDLTPTLALLDKLKGMLNITKPLEAIVSGVTLLADGEFRRLLFGSIKSLFKKDATFPSLIGGEYGTFHQYAGGKDHQPDIEHLSFEANYFLTFASHYEAMPEDAQQLYLIHFSAGIRRFLYLHDALRKKFPENGTECHFYST